MMLAREQIVTLHKIAKNGDNRSGRYNVNKSSEASLPLRMLEGKVLVDRWGNITEVFAFHPKNEELVHSKLREFANKQTSSTEHYDGESLWGADIVFSDAVPEDEILVISNLHRLEELLDPVEDDGCDDQCIDHGRALATVLMPSKL